MLKAAIRKGTLAVEFFPVLCGTALGNTGVKLLLDAVIDYLPSPLDIESIKCTDADGNEVTVPYDKTNWKKNPMTVTTF